MNQYSKEINNQLKKELGEKPPALPTNKTKKGKNSMFCKNCKNEVSKRASACPKCGEPICGEVGRDVSGCSVFFAYFLSLICPFAGIISGLFMMQKRYFVHGWALILIGLPITLGIFAGNSSPQKNNKYITKPTSLSVINTKPIVQENKDIITKSDTVSQNIIASDIVKEETVVKKYGLRETVTVGYTSYCVNGFFFTSKLGENPFIDLKPNGIYLVLDITVRNDDKEARIIPPIYLVDDNENKFQESSNGAFLENHLGSLVSLNPTMQKRGRIAFDVVPNKHYRLLISGGFWSEEETFIDFNELIRK